MMKPVKGLIFLVLVSTLRPALADNLNIPNYLIADYHRSLELRQYYLEDRAMSERNLADCDRLLNQIQKQLFSVNNDATQRSKLLALRAQLQKMEDQYRRELDEDRADVAKIESDLAGIEKDMKHYATQQ